jgi:NAD(P)-dependent dehydrogenase (short-subunit alcohol dehydrogenase family)
VEKRFTNKVVVVTGATKGIGLACAEATQKGRCNRVCLFKEVTQASLILLSLI